MIKSARSVTESGAGLVGSFLGAIAFLAFVMLATHGLVGLYATSVITAVAWDDARTVASDPQRNTTVADTSVNARLDGFDNVETDWQFADDGSIGLTIAADRPMLLPSALADGSFTRIERTVWVRNEVLE